MDKKNLCKAPSRAAVRKSRPLMAGRLLFHNRLVSALLKDLKGTQGLAVAAVMGRAPDHWNFAPDEFFFDEEGVSFLLLQGEGLESRLEKMAEDLGRVGCSLAAGPPGLAAPDCLIEAARQALESPPAGGGVRFGSAARLRADVPFPGPLELQEAGQALSLVYQPQVRLKDGSFSGSEVLARLPDGSGGTESASHFFANSDRRALVRFDRWVLKESLRQAVAWQTEGLSLQRLSVNFPLDAFDAPGIAAEILKDLAGSGLASWSLILELTEIAPAENLSTVRRELEQLRAEGVGIALDDLGSGYASLDLLQELPFTRVKIDRSFITGLETSQERYRELSALISFAHDLGLKVLAEGVEREGQRRILRDLGCDYYQGFLYSPALAKVELGRLLARLAKGGKMPR